MAKVAELDDVSLLKIFIGLRDKRSRRKAAYDADDVGDKHKQNKIETEFLRRFNERGIDNVSSREFGTAYRATRSSATVADWEAVLNHVKEHDAWELLERRVSKGAIQQYRDVHDDLPPGVSWSEAQVINFRRK
jgi:hypothetical protein|tara:strand:+ start:836 stop:1237 length:402 start_codon:yes stop_codon:yes gene_type:complete